MRRAYLVALWVVLLAATGCEQRGVRQSPSVAAGARAPVAETSTEDAPEPETGVAEEPSPQIPNTLGQSDVGIFSEYDERVRVRFPSWLEDAHAVVVAGPEEAHTPFAYVDGSPAGPAVRRPGSIVELESWTGADADGDGIPNGFDILLGAKKTALNAAPYKGGYRGLNYPGGDVPRDEGVCTDVLVRAVRNAGIDLQVELHEDIKRSPSSFPMVETPDPNIDQRRVKTLLPYFERQWESLPADPKETSRPWLPGDIVFMNTMRDERPDHVGIVSDRLGESGYPLIVNNWTNGFHTKEMDLLDQVPVTHRFRVRSKLAVPAEHRGLSGILTRHRLTVPDDTGQLVLVTSYATNTHYAHLQRFERGGDGWASVGRPVRAVLGSAGFARGRGLHPERALVDLGAKREGDRRSPAGVFDIGTAFGPGEKPYEGAWQWRTTNERSRWIDDPESPHYNTWQEVPASGDIEWSSAEKLSRYELALVIRHNDEPVKPGAGSAIFLHTWQGPDTPTIGCSAVDRDHLVELLGWLQPSKRPVVIQVPALDF